MADAIYFDNISHFGLSVDFWQIKSLVVVWCALRFFTIRKNRSKKRRSRFAEKVIIIMGVWLWHWNQSPINPIEASRRGKTEKSTSSSVKCEGFVYCFLRLEWRGTSWILTTRSYGQYGILSWSYAPIALCNSTATRRILEKLIMDFAPW